MLNFKKIGIAFLALICLLGACGEVTPNVPEASPNPVATTTPETKSSTSPANTLQSPTVKVAVTPSPQPTSPGLVTAPQTTTAANPKPTPFKEIVEVTTDITFTLKFGQVAKVAAENLELKLLNVVEDSRCPVNVNCAWSGQLILTVAATQNGQVLENFAVNSIEAYRTRNKATFGKYNLSLLGATPGRFYINPTSGDGKTKPIQREDYEIKFLLTKLD